MFRPYYESHHTFDAGDEADFKVLAELADAKFSKIDGDPLLGEKVYFYLTFHASTEEEMKRKWFKLETLLPFYPDFFWIRRKIEYIILDERRESNSSGE